MDRQRVDLERNILTFFALTEGATGIAAIIDPVMLVRLLLGADVGGPSLAVARVLGVALLSFGVACSPSARAAERSVSVVRAAIVYNLLVALYLAYLGAVGHLAGVMLWPAVALHAAIGAALLWSRR